MAMGKIYIGQKLIILLHIWAKKGISKQKTLSRPYLMSPKLKKAL